MVRNLINRPHDLLNRPHDLLNYAPCPLGGSVAYVSLILHELVKQ